jgi:hypothetical protein
MAATGFKEWQVVCDALASGRQSILLRKGGIHEGRSGFAFAHRSFFLFSTRFHVSADQVREGEVKVMAEWTPGETVRVTHHVQAEWAITLTDWAKVANLEALHIYSEKTLRDRFDWQGKGMASGSLHLAVVRVFTLATPWEFPYEPKYGGCRSWLELPEPPAAWREAARPVMEESAFNSLADALTRQCDL